MGFQFMDFCGFQDFYEIYGSSMGLFPYLTEIIGKILLLGFRILDFKQDFSICVQDFSLLLTPRYHDSCDNHIEMKFVPPSLYWFYIAHSCI